MFNKFKDFLHLVNLNQSIGNVAKQSKFLLEIGEEGRFLINCSKIMETWRLKETVEKNPNLIDFYFKNEKLNKDICYSPLSQILKLSGPYADEQALYLIEKGADINRVANIEGKTPLILAFQYHCFNVVEKMINMGVDVNTVDNNQNNSLLHFYKFSYLIEDEAYFPKLNKMVNLLRLHDFDFNHVDDKGNNVLFYASYFQPNNITLIQTLIDYGIDTKHKNQEGLNFIDFYEKGMLDRVNKKSLINTEDNEFENFFKTLKEKLLLEENIYKENKYYKKSKNSKI